MITLYYHKSLKLGIVTRDGMPAIVITDELVMEYENFMNIAKLKARQAGKQEAIAAQYEIILRCPDESVGWERL